MLFIYLLGFQTLGEEYVNIIQVNSMLRKQQTALVSVDLQRKKIEILIDMHRQGWIDR